MRNRTARRLLLGLTATSAAVATVLAPAAEAIPSPDDVSAAMSRMLTYADVPRDLRVAPGWEFTVKDSSGVASARLSMELCTRNGTEITARPVDLMYQVELGETDAEDDPRSLQQNIWEYRTTLAAERAWAQVKQRVTRCAGRTRESDGAAGRKTSQYLSNGSTSATVNGRAGIWVNARTAASTSSDDGGADGAFYVFFLVGTAISSVEFDITDPATPSARERREVTRVAQQLAYRWLGTDTATDEAAAGEE